MEQYKAASGGPLPAVIASCCDTCGGRGLRTVANRAEEHGADSHQSQVVLNSQSDGVRERYPEH